MEKIKLERETKINPMSTDFLLTNGVVKIERCFSAFGIDTIRFISDRKFDTVTTRICDFAYDKKYYIERSNGEKTETPTTFHFAERITKILSGGHK